MKSILLCCFALCPSTMLFAGELKTFTGDYHFISESRVLDKSTGLIWQSQDNGKFFERVKEAASYCENLKLDGQWGWRLPTIKELGSLLQLIQPKRAC